MGRTNGAAVQIWTTICAYLLVAIVKCGMVLPGRLHQFLEVGFLVKGGDEYEVGGRQLMTRMLSQSSDARSAGRIAGSFQKENSAFCA